MHREIPKYYGQRRIFSAFIYKFISYHLYLSIYFISFNYFCIYAEYLRVLEIIQMKWGQNLCYVSNSIFLNPFMTMKEAVTI